jgi:REP element-mobilizing transposase RayT
MGYHLRIESPDVPSFVTTRCRNSELWFINNDPLQQAILGYAAKFASRYSVKIYALAIEGNHIHMPILTPEENRAYFMRDFNSCVAKAVKRHTPEYPGGTLWERRYSSEAIPPEEDDVEEWFFYTVLQPIKDGLVPRLSEYPGYNCFQDAIWGRERKFKVVDWARYNAALRYNSNLDIKDFTEVVPLKYQRLPGYEHLTQQEYAKLMTKKLKKRIKAIHEQRAAKGLGYVGRERLLLAKRGSIPRNTKKSGRQTHRPRVLSKNPKLRAHYLKLYFQVYYEFQEASERYRAGELTVRFPPGTYRPYSKSMAPPLAEAA